MLKRDNMENKVNKEDREVKLEDKLDKDFKKLFKLGTKEFCVLYVGLLRLVIAYLLLLLLPIAVSPYALLTLIILLAIDIYVFSIGTQYKLSITLSIVMISTTFLLRVYATTFDGEIVIIVTHVILLSLIVLVFLYQTYMSMKYVYKRITLYEEEIKERG